jgi:hypothetical protein
MLRRNHHCPPLKSEYYAFQHKSKEWPPTRILGLLRRVEGGNRGCHYPFKWIFAKSGKRENQVAGPFGSNGNAFIK